MKFYLTSDLHIDHYCDSRTEVAGFIKRFLPSDADVLLVAGDTSDNPQLFVEFYRQASPLYEHIFLIFGNHDLTVRHDDFFQRNTFTETRPKLDWLKEKILELPNVTLLDGDVANFGGIKIGGCMGFNDFSVGIKSRPMSKEHLVANWRNWFDNVHWRYMNNDPSAILKSELAKLDRVVASQPKIVMTHFIPTACGIPQRYAEEITNAFFYFNVDEYLDSMKNKSIWHAGHTHEFSVGEYRAGGKLFPKKVTLLVNPLGYPMETKGKFSLAKRKQYAMIEL